MLVEQKVIANFHHLEVSVNQIKMFFSLNPSASAFKVA
jgi:hypothetical protein